jgi:hypothetical protein
LVIHHGGAGQQPSAAMSSRRRPAYSPTSAGRIRLQLAPPARGSFVACTPGVRQNTAERKCAEQCSLLRELHVSDPMLLWPDGECDEPPGGLLLSPTSSGNMPLRGHRSVSIFFMQSCSFNQFEFCMDWDRLVSRNGFDLFVPTNSLIDINSRYLH